MKEIFVAVVTSLIASFIFWVIFNYIPEKRRYNKVRPKVEFDIYEIFIKLGGYINIALQINEYSRYFPFEPIETGRATKEDFELWLQNKCLSSDYLFDEMKEKLMPVGDALQKDSDEICDKIEKCATYYSFMTAEEILLLRKISAKVKTYSYNMPAEEKVGQSILRVAVPTIAYMAENFYDLSKLYVSLQQIVWSYKKIDRTINKYIISDFHFNEARKCYTNGDFKKCLRLIKKSKNENKESKLRLQFMVYYNLGKIPKAIAALKSYLEIASDGRYILYSIVGDKYIDWEKFDETIWDLISKEFSDVDIVEVMQEQQVTRTIEKQGLDNAKEIKAFYEERLRQSHENAAKRMKEKKKNIEEKLVSLSQKSEEQSCV